MCVCVSLRLVDLNNYSDVVCIGWWLAKIKATHDIFYSLKKK